MPLKEETKQPPSVGISSGIRDNHLRGRIGDFLKQHIKVVQSCQ